MTLTIPIERLGIVPLDERDAVADIAIGLYKRQAVSLGRAAEVAGITSVELLTELGRRHIPINYGADELREDAAIADLAFNNKAGLQGLEFGDFHPEISGPFLDVFPAAGARKFSVKLIAQRNRVVIIQKDEVITDGEVMPRLKDHAVFDGARDWANVHHFASAKRGIFECCSHI